MVKSKPKDPTWWLRPVTLKSGRHNHKSSYGSLRAGRVETLIEESYVRGRTASQTTYAEGGPYRRLDTHIAPSRRYYERVLSDFCIPDETLATFTSLGIGPRKLGFDYQTQVEGEDWLITIDYETGFIARIETAGGLVTAVTYRVGELADQPPASTEEGFDPPITEIYDYDLSTVLAEMGLTGPPEVAGLSFKTATRYVNLELSEMIYAAADGREAQVARRPGVNHYSGLPLRFETELHEPGEMSLSFDAPSEEVLRALVAAFRPGATFKVHAPRP